MGVGLQSAGFRVPWGFGCTVYDLRLMMRDVKMMIPVESSVIES